MKSPAGSNPFPGLRPFREDEEYLFFGRETQVDTLVDRLAATRFLAVVGSSGSGKSSLVNCGLRPALHRGLMARAGSAWRMAQFRPGSEPVRALAAALAVDGVLYSGYRGEVPLQEVIETRLQASKRGLVDLWAKAQPPADTQLLVVVDQFEELFRFRRLAAPDTDAEAALTAATAFVNLLLETRLHPDCRIYIVITMRSDFLGECARFYGLPEAINAGQYLVPRLTREERRAAIVGPVGVGGAEIDPVLLTRLLNDVGDNPDQLSILQHALHRTWALWEDPGGSQGPLGLVHYEACGTMARALDLHAESAYAELTPAQQGVCEGVMRALTDKGTDARGIRRPTALASLCAITTADEADVRAVVDAFRAPARSFLMPPAGEALSAGTVIDISHESLMRVWKRLQRWSDAEAQAARLYRRLVQTALLHREGQAELLRGPELERALDWQRSDKPNAAWALQYGAGFDVVSQFLAASEQARQVAADAARARRIGRRVLVGLTVVALVLFSGYMYHSERRASDLLKDADLAREVAQAAAVEAHRAQQEAVRLQQVAVASEAAAKDSAAAEAKLRVQVTQALADALKSAEAARRSDLQARQFQADAEDAKRQLAVEQARQKALERELLGPPAVAAAPKRAPAPAPVTAPAAPPPPPATPPPALEPEPIAPTPVVPAPAPPPAVVASAEPRAPDLTEDQLVAIMPRLQRHSSRGEWVRLLNSAMAEYDIGTVARRAAFLAQIAFESVEFRSLEESWGPSSFQKRYEPPGDLAQRLGNTEPGDGKLYRGRGLIQIVGRRNYATNGALVGVDLVGHPEQAAEPATAARLAAAFWKQRGLNELADAGQFEQITQRISGGRFGMQERLVYFDRATAVLRAGK